MLSPHVLFLSKILTYIYQSIYFVYDSMSIFKNVKLIYIYVKVNPKRNLDKRGMCVYMLFSDMDASNSIEEFKLFCPSKYIQKILRDY